MRCHQHLDSEAVSICVSCGRGLCRSCQQPTLEQRNLCGLPQCSKFAKRQGTVPFAIQQSFANRAAAHRKLAALLRQLTAVLVLPSGLLVLLLVAWISFHPLTSSVESFAAVGIGAVLIAVGFMIWRFQSNLDPVQRTWEDLAREFRVEDE
jgi:hypothetical protein